MSLRPGTSTLPEMPSNPLPRLALVLALFAAPLTRAQNAADTPEISALRTKAEKGNSIAQYNLGLAYATGRDVATDPSEAYVWLTLAAENGTTGRALQNLLDGMSPAQLAEGKRRLARQRADAAPAPAASGVATGPSSDQKELSAELAKAWKENESLKASLAEARVARDSATTDLSASATELATLRATVAKLKSQGADSGAADAPRELAEVRATAASLARRGQELEDIAAQRGRELAEARTALTAAQARIDQLTAAASTPAPADADAGKLSADLAEARSQLAKLKSMNDTLTQRLADAKPSADASEMEARLMQATGKRLEAEDRAKRAEAALQQAKDELATATAATASDQGTAAEFKSQLADLQAQLDREKSARADAESHAQSLASDLSDARHQLAAAPTAAPAAAAAPTPAPEADHAELADVKAKLSTALRSYTLLQQENDKLKGSSDQLAAQVASLEDQLASSQHDANSARDAAASSAQQAATAGSDRQQQLAQLRSDLDQQRQARNSAESKAQALAADLAVAKQHAATLSDQLGTASASAAQADILREQLRQTQDQLNAVRLENGQLRTRLAIIAPPPASTLAAPTRPGTASAETAVTAPPPPSAAVAAEAAAPTPAPADAAGPRTHTVVAGDTLSKIAREYYGTSLRWAEIYEANRNQLPNERALAVGMKLVIP